MKILKEIMNIKMVEIEKIEMNIKMLIYLVVYFFMMIYLEK